MFIYIERERESQRLADMGSGRAPRTLGGTDTCREFTKGGFSKGGFSNYACFHFPH